MVQLSGDTVWPVTPDASTVDASTVPSWLPASSAAAFPGPGVILTFLPAFLAARRLGVEAVAAVVAAQQPAPLAAGPLISRVVDATGRRARRPRCARSDSLLGSGACAGLMQLAAGGAGG
jgi:hypothetical protein